MKNQPSAISKKAFSDKVFWAVILQVLGRNTHFLCRGFVPAWRTAESVPRPAARRGYSGRSWQ
ncbi:MAG: hypothetical protein ABFR82_16520, partial [Nitrospirota bacterium]